MDSDGQLLFSPMPQQPSGYVAAGAWARSDIYTHELCLQEKVRDGYIVPVKIKHVFHVAVLMAKHQNLETITSILSGCRNIQ